MPGANSQQLDTKFLVACTAALSCYSRPKDFLEVKYLLDIIDMLFPRSIAGLAVFFRHFAAGWGGGEEEEQEERRRRSSLQSSANFFFFFFFLREKKSSALLFYRQAKRGFPGYMSVLLPQPMHAGRQAQGGEVCPTPREVI